VRYSPFLLRSVSFQSHMDAKFRKAVCKNNAINRQEDDFAESVRLWA
jgi:hypothetical protein